MLSVPVRSAGEASPAEIRLLSPASSVASSAPVAAPTPTVLAPAMRRAAPGGPEYRAIFACARDSGESAQEK
jgi:hypothetical protein